MSEEWWLCGQIRDKFPGKERWIWDLQGVFQTEQMAIKACRTDKYFIFPMELNKIYPDEPSVSPRGYYPLG